MQPGSPSDAIYLTHHPCQTEQAYVNWLTGHVLVQRKQMSATKVQAYLTVLAIEASVVASIENHLLSALLFVHREVLQEQLGTVDAPCAKRPKCLCAVPTKAKMLRVLGGHGDANSRWTRRP